MRRTSLPAKYVSERLNRFYCGCPDASFLQNAWSRRLPTCWSEVVSCFRQFNYFFLYNLAFFGFNSSSPSQPGTLKWPLLVPYHALALPPDASSPEVRISKLAIHHFTKLVTWNWEFRESEPYLAVWLGCVLENISHFLAAKLMNHILFVLLQSRWRHQYNQRQTRANWP